MVSITLDSSSFCGLSVDLFSLWQRLSVAKYFSQHAHYRTASTAMAPMD